MAKRNLKKEKAKRNEENAKRFKDEHEKKDRPQEKRKATWRNWCRMPGHPAQCSCTLPTRGEVIEASRGRR